MKRIAARFAVLGAGAVVMLIGALVLAFRPGAAPTAFGWTAYAPRHDFAFVPTSGFALPVGLALVIAGFVAIVGWIAFEIGRSHRGDAPAAAERPDIPPSR